VTSTNYLAATGLTPTNGAFVINKIAPTASISNTPQNYTGSAQTATVACLGGGTATLASGGTGTNAGSYPATVDCVTSTNYLAAAGLTPTNGAFVINKIAPTASITNSPVTYTGSAQTATVACLGGGSATLASGGTGTNAGAYPATVDCAASINYTIANGLSAGSFVIDPATPTASITNSPVIYTGSAQTATVACLGGGTATLASGGTGTNAGLYPATVDCAASANYNLANGLSAGSFVITAKPITVTAGAGQSKVFGAVDPTFTYTSSDLNATFTGTLDRVAGEDVGFYSIGKGTLAVVGSNYSMSFGSDDFSITAKDIHVTPTAGQSKVFGAANPTYAYTYDTMVGSDAISGALSRTAGEDVNTYSYLIGTVAVTTGTSSNYNLILDAETFAITAKDIHITPTAGQSKVFGKANPAYVYSYGTMAGSDAISGALSRVAGENVNTYSYLIGTVAVTTGTPGNYNLILDPETFAISAKDIHVTPTAGQSKVFGAANPTYAYTYDTMVGSDAISGALSRVAGEDVNTYSYLIGTVAVTTGTPANYNLILDAQTFAITKATAVCTVVGYTGAYDGTAHGASGSCTGVGLDVLTGLNLGSSFTDVPGGIANWTFTGGTNYNNDSGTAAIDISKATATCAIVGFTGTYDGAAHGASGTCTGVGGALDVLTGLNLGSSFTDVPGGIANWAFTDSTGNYNDNSGTAAIVLSKATAVCTVVGYTGAYDGAAHGASGECTGVGGALDVLTGLDLGSSFTNVPGGSANWAFTGGTNYSDDSGTAAIILNKASLTVTANNKTIHFGSPTPAFGFAADGFISPDSFVTAPSCSVSGAPTAVGTYPIICAGGDAGTNYNINYVDGTYTISDKVILDVIASSATITYGDADPVITPAYSGFTGGDGASALNVAPSCSATGPFTAISSPHTSSCSGGSDDKYDFNFINGSVTVNAKALTVTASNANKIYGSVASFIGSEFTTPALVGTDSVISVTLTSTGSDATATVGGYDIVPSAAIGTGLGNYSISYANGTLTVDPKVLTITANNASKTYGVTKTFAGTEFAAPDLVNGDLVASVTLTSTGAVNTANVGSFNIVPSAAIGTGLGNYTLAYANGTLSVNKATLTVTANNQTIPFGSADPAFTFVYGTFVNGENASALTTAPACTVSGAHTAAGTYPITCSGGVAANYSFNYVHGILTVSAVSGPTEAYIGGILRGGYLLGAGESTRQNYAGIDSGPVKVVHTGGAPIVSAIREAWAVNGVTTSFFQMMGLPQEQLSDTYVFPGYNNVTLNEQLRISNVDSVSSTVTVTIGGVLRGTYPLAAGEAVRINYAGLDSGPVVVQGTTGVKIISAIREAWAVNGVTKSFVQLMGLPKEQLSDQYVFPGYNNVTLNEQLRIGNVDSVESTVTVTIGGVLRGTYTLQPNEAVRVNYAGVDSGPVIVQGTTGVKIISAIREAWAVNGVTTSFAQLMGLPSGQLSNKYVFPGYNNVTLNDQLRIGNVDSVQTTVTVTIGGVLRGTYTLQPNEAVRVNYSGVDSGPVVVEGTTGVNIISAIREAWAVNGVTQSFVQLMGLPSGQLSSTFWFPAYNNVTLNEQLRIAVP
jgi:hypothetical protein